MEDKNKSERQPAVAKKPYRRPDISFYGDVTQITRGVAGKGEDGSPGMSRVAPCWIAEVLYGVDGPRTYLVRMWLADCESRGESWALLVVPLYRRFGQSMASAVRSCGPLRRLVRPIFDYAVDRAHHAYASRVAVAHRAG